MTYPIVRKISNRAFDYVTKKMHYFGTHVKDKKTKEAHDYIWAVTPIDAVYCNLLPGDVKATSVWLKLSPGQLRIFEESGIKLTAAKTKKRPAREIHLIRTQFLDVTEKSPTITHVNVSQSPFQLMGQKLEEEPPAKRAKHEPVTELQKIVEPIQKKESGSSTLLEAPKGSELSQSAPKGICSIFNGNLVQQTDEKALQSGDSGLAAVPQPLDSF